MAQGNALQVFLEERNLDQAVVGDPPVGQHRLERRKRSELHLVGALAGIGRQESGHEHVHRVEAHAAAPVRLARVRGPRQEAGVRVVRPGIGRLHPVRDHGAIVEEAVERPRRVAVVGIAAAAEGGLDGDRAHRETTAHLLGHALLHEIDIGTFRIGAVRAEVDLQARDRLQIGPDGQVLRAVDHRGCRVVHILHEPSLLIRLVDEIPTHGSEGEPQARRQGAHTALPEDIAHLGRETGDHHTIRRGILHVHPAEHHQETGSILDRVSQQVLHRGGARRKGQLHVRRILCQDPYLIQVQRLELDDIAFAIRANGTHLHLPRQEAMLYDNAAVGTELHLLLHLGLLLLLLLLLTAVRPRGSRELLVDLFQVAVLVIERLEVETTLPADVALVLDRITDLQLLADHRRPAIPVIGRVVGNRAGRPVEYRDLLQRHIPSRREGLVILQRRTQVADTLFHGILPQLIVVRIQLLVYLHVRLLDPGIRTRGEGHAQVVGEIPPQAESAIPLEIVAISQ